MKKSNYYKRHKEEISLKRKAVYKVLKYYSIFSMYIVFV